MRYNAELAEELLIIGDVLDAVSGLSKIRVA